MKLQFQKIVLNNWGFIIFCLVTLGSIVIFSRFPDDYHYRIFTFPVSALWSGLDPYGINVYNREIDSAFPYSPASAMFFFSWFAYLPFWTGRALYLLVSLLVLGFGCYTVREFFTGKDRSILWLMLGSVVNPAILSSKIEMFEFGILLVAFSSLYYRKPNYLFLFLLGFITNWKFQTLPYMGLITVALFFDRQNWIPLSVAWLGFIAAWASPLIVYSPVNLLALNKHWLGHLEIILERNWIGYHHLYGTLNAFGSSIDLVLAKRMGTLLGAVLAVYVAVVATRSKDRSLSLLVAMGLAAGFVVLLSPMTQLNGYLLYFALPLVLSEIQRRYSPLDSRTYLCVLVFCYFLISLLMADLFPKVVRNWARFHMIANWGVLFLIGLLVFFTERILRSHKYFPLVSPARNYRDATT